MNKNKFLLFAVAIVSICAVAFTACSKSDDLAALQSSASANLKSASDSTLVDSLAPKHHHHGICDSLKVAPKDSLGLGKRHHGTDSVKVVKPRPVFDSTYVKPFRPKGGSLDSIAKPKKDSLNVFPPKGGGHGRGGRK